MPDSEAATATATILMACPSLAGHLDNDEPREFLSQVLPTPRPLCFSTRVSSFMPSLSKKLCMLSLS